MLVLRGLMVRLAWLYLATIALGMSVGSGKVHAMDISVTGNVDTYPAAPPGNCAAAGCSSVGTPITRWDCPSLRRAVACANSLAGTDTITFAATGTTTYSLTRRGNCDDNNFRGDLDITDDVYIIGHGSGTTIVSGVGLHAGGSAATDRVFHVVGAHTVEFQDLTVEDGWSHHDCAPTQETGGGCIRNAGGDLTLDSVEVNDCKVVGEYVDEGGGGVWSGEYATLAIAECDIYSNVAEEGWGAGIQALGDATIEESAIYYNDADKTNTGGGIASHADLSVSDTTIYGNQASWSGGGLFLANDGTATVTVHHSSFTENSQTTAQPGSPYPDNIWFGGGAIGAYNGAVGSFENVTISGNLASSWAGGIYTFLEATYSEPVLDFLFATVADNYASYHPGADGVDCAYNAATGDGCTFEESIVDDYCRSSVFSAGVTLDSTTGATCAAFSGTGNADLDTLSGATNGTRIHHLGASSDALGAATAATCTSVGDDQEGDSRSSTCDLGADED